MVIFHSYVSLPEGMFLFHPYFFHSLMRKNHRFFGFTCHSSLPAPFGGESTWGLIDFERPLRDSWENMLEKCWRTCWIEISINQQVSFNLWPSSTMFWQRLEQLWAWTREGLHMFVDAHEPFWFWSRSFFWREWVFQFAINDHRRTNYRFPIQTYRILMLINKLIAKWCP